LDIRNLNPVDISNKEGYWENRGAFYSAVAGKINYSFVQVHAVPPLTPLVHSLRSLRVLPVGLARVIK
jgi:hypothetical protein